MAVSSKEMAVFLKILGMLGSDFEGERAAAGLKASEFLRSRNLQWSDVVGVPVQRQERERPQERYRRYRYNPDEEPFDNGFKSKPPAKHVAVCITLLKKYRHLLTVEEAEFVEKVMTWPFLLNAYRERLKAIIAKVKAKR